MNKSELIDAFKTVIRLPSKVRVSIALATDVGGLTVLGGAEHPVRKITRYSTIIL